MNVLFGKIKKFKKHVILPPSLTYIVIKHFERGIYMKIINFKRLFFIGLITASSMSMAACDETTVIDDSAMEHLTGQITPTTPVNSSGEPDLSTYPLGIQKGYITLEYFDILMTFFDEVEHEGWERKKLEDEYKDVAGIENYVFVSLERDFLTYLDSITYTPTNAIEEKIHEQFLKVITHSQIMTEYRVKYYSGSASYKDLISNESELYLNEIELLIKTMDHYELFLEE